MKCFVGNADVAGVLIVRLLYGLHIEWCRGCHKQKLTGHFPDAQQDTGRWFPERVTERAPRFQ